MTNAEVLAALEEARRLYNSHCGMQGDMILRDLIRSIEAEPEPLDTFNEVVLKGPDRDWALEHYWPADEQPFGEGEECLVTVKVYPREVQDEHDAG
ncbi:MAG: hypothetical protein A2Z21_09460 [Candidatus Fraserbacteria bacterium RBG_16_55_9]|uniref:Uncharacterized protein n=1 Tax=Fraserbacteria sp. (strain RBG_16_55_9) TaxID=1817864 RepID=A0A1F5UNW9_FRAXR|nr:MAG: hypothetical protein A2Z21_09460 [Candidatus Fraserbacteria bacterium RBG_16_55_9]